EVGWALNSNSAADPCPAHRVVNREGKLSGGWAFGSPDIQRGLLEEEGVSFLPDGRVDLERHLWKPGAEAEPPEEMEEQRPLF
ncbi:MAG TPA: MGMT family protein, partial [Chloroflexota bacterium]